MSGEDMSFCTRKCNIEIYNGVNLCGRVVPELLDVIVRIKLFTCLILKDRKDI